MRFDPGSQVKCINASYDITGLLVLHQVYVVISSEAWDNSNTIRLHGVDFSWNTVRFELLSPCLTLDEYD